MQGRTHAHTHIFMQKTEVRNNIILWSLLIAKKSNMWTTDIQLNFEKGNCKTFHKNYVVL